MIAERLPNWPSLLAAYIEQRRCMPFAWGSQDCCQFARGQVLAITGEDPAASWRLRSYHTARGAARALYKLGGLENLPGRAGLVEIPVRMAGRGDLVLFSHDGQLMLAGCVGHQVAVPAARGLTFYPTTQGQRAWRVGQLTRRIV